MELFKITLRHVELYEITQDHGVELLTQNQAHRLVAGAASVQLERRGGEHRARNSS